MDRIDEINPVVFGRMVQAVESLRLEVQGLRGEVELLGAKVNDLDLHVSYGQGFRKGFILGMAGLAALAGGAGGGAGALIMRLFFS